jgi:tetratricopeptide (TPR) repeat protein
LEKYQNAIQDFSRAIELLPDFCYDYINRGNLYYKLGQYDKAIQDYSKALKLEPEPGVDNYIYYRRGASYYKTKQYDKAIKDFSVLTDAGGCFQRASIYCEFKQYDKAIKEYSKAIQLKQSNQIWEYSQAAYLCIMEICILDGKSKQFEHWLEQFEESIPKNELSKGNLAIKLFLILAHKCVMNESTTDIEKQLDVLLKYNIELDWSFELTDEWLKSSKNGLTSEQIKYIKSLTSKLKDAQRVQI